MRAGANGFDFARGSCLPARPDLPVGAGNWRGAGSPRPFYSNTMTDGRADCVAPHRGAAVVIGGAPTLLLDGEPCGPGVPGSQVLRRGGVIRFAAAPVQPVAVIADPVDDAMGGAVIAPEPAAEAGRCGPLPAPDRGADREIWAHLQALGNAAPFDAGIDLQICEDLGRGLKPDMIAADLGLDTKQVVARFRALSAPIRDDRDRVKPDGQARLVAELRRRVDWAAGAARGA